MTKCRVEEYIGSLNLPFLKCLNLENMLSFSSFLGETGVKFDLRLMVSCLLIGTSRNSFGSSSIWEANLEESHDLLFRDSLLPGRNVPKKKKCYYLFSGV